MEHPLHILLVEDEVIFAMLLKAQLIRAGYDICKHEVTGENAIISAQQEKPDLILMDIKLAGSIDGIEAASNIKSFSDIPIIFMTCYDNKDVRKRAMKTNPLDYLVKPITIEKLKLIIDSYFVR